MLKVTDEFLKKTLNCKTPDELQALAKAEGITLSPEEAKRFLDEANNAMSDDLLDKVAGGAGYVTNC